MFSTASKSLADTRRTKQCACCSAQCEPCLAARQNSCVETVCTVQMAVTQEDEDFGAFWCFYQWGARPLSSIMRLRWLKASLT